MTEEEADPWELLISAIKARDAEIERILTESEKDKNTLLTALEVATKEIERLKAALDAIDDHGRALSFVETLNAQKAEIEAFKQAHATSLKTQLVLNTEIERLKGEYESLKHLITELADWIYQWRQVHESEATELVQRAREASSEL